MTQGYQLIAMGDARYLAMAEACAASIRHWDGKRPIQLVTDRAEAAPRPGLFDHVTPLPPDPGFAGPAVKLRIAEAAIFAETMFVDADCLMLKADIDRHWAMLAEGPAIGIAGHWRTAGDWYGMDIAEMCRLGDVGRLAQHNSGAIYVRTGAEAAAFFATARALLAGLGNFTGLVHYGIGPSDEPYLALAMARHGIDPRPMRLADDPEAAWMIATINGRDFALDPWSGHPRFIRRRSVSPTLCHFVGLSPRADYERLAKAYLARFARSPRRDQPPSSAAITASP